MSKIIKIESDVEFVVEERCGWPSRMISSHYEGVVITLDDGEQVKFGISSYQNCCENWGYLAAKDDMDEFIGAELLDVMEVSTYPEGISKPFVDYDSDEFQAVNVSTSKGLLQFVVYNSHNGYYSHATILVDRGKTTTACL